MRQRIAKAPQVIHLCSFSGAVVDLKPRMRTPANVLAVLAKHPRVSTFDMSETPWLAGCIDTLLSQGLIVEDKTEPYPWHRFNPTKPALAAGEKA